MKEKLGLDIGWRLVVESVVVFFKVMFEVGMLLRCFMRCILKKKWGCLEGLVL